MNSHMLILMRHAKSDWNADAPTDFDRPLNKRGNKTAPLMGKWLKQNDLVPDLMVSSPALRARQTSVHVAKATGFAEEDILWEKRIYGASLEDMLDVIADHGSKAGSLFLAGHNPSMDSLLEYLSKDKPDYTPSGKLMTTANIAVLDFGKDPVSIQARAARLKFLVRPGDLKSNA